MSPQIPGVTKGLNSLTIELREIQIGHLQRLAEARGTTADQVVAMLIEREFHSTVLVSADESPWLITDRAKRQFLQILGTPCDLRALGEAETVLGAAAKHAYLAEREGTRAPKELLDGVMQYRGPRPLRLTLLVQFGALIGVSMGGRSL